MPNPLDCHLVAAGGHADTAATTQKIGQLARHHQDVAAITRQHLGLGRLDTCQVEAESKWMHSKSGVCMPVQVSGSFNGTLLMKCMLPHLHAEPRCSDAADDVLRSELGAHGWIQHSSPIVRIPRVYGFGLPGHRDFTHESCLGIHRRLWRAICRVIRRVTGYPTLTYFAPSALDHGLPTAYVLMEFVGSDVGEKLSDTWDQHHHNPARVEALFRSLARIMLTMSRVENPRIGSFRFNDDGTVTLANRPLMRSIMTLDGQYQKGTRTTRADGTYGCVDSFVADMISLHGEHVLACSPGPAAGDARRLNRTIGAMLRELSHRFVRERRNGPFASRLAGLHPGNILVDADWNITCVLGIEEVCALPLEMESVPLWIAGCPVADLAGARLDKFDRLRRLFTQILQEEEASGPSRSHPLSLIMRRAWDSRAIWFWHSLCSPNTACYLIPRHLMPELQSGSFTQIEQSPVGVRREDENKEAIDKIPRVTHGSPPSRGDVDSYAASKMERDRQREAYTKSIAQADVYKLASNHNLTKACHEFRKPEHGSFNVCFFVRFPSDGREWVVRFPLDPVLHDAWGKLQSEVTTMKYLKLNTTIPVPRVYGYGPGGTHDTNNPTGLPYVILEYIPGRPLDPDIVLKSSDNTSRAFYTQLARILSQLRMQEFDCSGSLTTDSEGGITLTSPHSVDLNSVQLSNKRQPVPYQRQTTVVNFARFRYQVLSDRLNQPASEIDEEDAQHEIWALADYRERLFNFVDASRKDRFVLSHGDLRPANIIVSEDLTINAIIDWEWSCTVPPQFFIPPMWFAGSDIPLRSDNTYRLEYSKFHQALTDAAVAGPACRVLATEWGPDLSSSVDLFLPAALLHHHNFTFIYYLFLFPEFFKGVKRQEKLQAFYENDGPDGAYNEAVRRKLEACEAYGQYLRDKGLLDRIEAS